MGNQWGVDMESIKANLSTVKFDHQRLLDILQAPYFPETAAKQWIDDHFYLTIQVRFHKFDIS